MPRGGKRTGKVGKAYSNRSDLNTAATQPPKAAQGQGYGKAGAQKAAQRAIPLPNVQSVSVRRGEDGRISGVDIPQAAPQAAPQSPAGTPPGSLTALDAPTEQPGMPVTAGVPHGAGPGAEAMGFDDGSGAILVQLRALMKQFPSTQLAELIAEASGE